MRIVLSYATEFDHHEGHQIARALKALGHDVAVVNATVPAAADHWSEVQTYSADAQLNDVLGPAGADLFLYIEPRGLLPRSLERAACHTACILCDTMLSLEPRIDISHLFDDVLLYHPHALDLLPRDRARVHWTPYGIDPELFVDRHGRRDIDVAFVGSTEAIWKPRRHLLKRIASRYNTNDFFAPRCAFDEIAALYNRAKIVIHIPIVDALNPRIFEAMGCGALLITGRVDDRLDELFTSGEHLVVYDSEDDAIAKIDYFLEHDDERARIARAGYEAVHRDHTYARRFQPLLEKVSALPRGAAPAREMPADHVDDIYQRRHKQAGQVRPLLRDAVRQPMWSAARYRALVRAGTTLVRRSITALR